VASEPFVNQMRRGNVHVKASRKTFKNIYAIVSASAVDARRFDKPLEGFLVVAEALCFGCCGAAPSGAQRRKGGLDLIARRGGTGGALHGPSRRRPG
jgi:hypothetical protein